MRLNPVDRKRQILDAAIAIAETDGGWHKLTRTNVAARAGCTDGLVSRYFGTMKSFKRTIMRTAIKQEILCIVAQGLAANDIHANAAPLALRARALSTLIAK